MLSEILPVGDNVFEVFVDGSIAQTRRTSGTGTLDAVRLEAAKRFLLTRLSPEHRQHWQGVALTTDVRNLAAKR